MEQLPALQTILPALRPLLHRLRRAPVFLCIGSDRVTGDSLGPLVGHLLTEVHRLPAYVYGSLHSPVTALNLTETVAAIRRRHAGCKIVAIDSSVGAEDEVGNVRVFRGSIKPGAADGKKLPRVGDVSITATVAAGSHKNLYSVRLGFVYTLAAGIAQTICDALAESTGVVTA